jgi:hypothetical protein
MPVNTLNNEKTENIKESLAELLNQLKWKKSKFNEVVEFASGGLPLPFYFDIDSLNKGIATLEKLEFTSADDFYSVKKLREAELFFSKIEGLKTFKFPDYKPQINPMLLTYADIDIQLDVLSKKSEELLRRNPNLAAWEAKYLIFDFRNLNRWYFEEKKIDCEEYKSRALHIIDETQPVLEHHLGFKEILVNLLLLVATLGIAPSINKAVNGHFLFFQKNYGAKQLDEISQTLTTAKHLSP